MYLTDLADVLKAAGLPVVEIAGWQTRGHAPMVDVRTIVCHHTAGLDDRQVVLAGRPGLPGPLAHFWLSRTGVWHVIAAGLCYHAGVSRDPSYTNSHAIGIEAEALGTGVAGDWPDVQMDAYVAGARALANHYEVPYSRVLGHKETCAPVGRKADPNFNMTAFRTRLEETDMPLNDADKAWLLDKLPREFWRYDQDGAKPQAWGLLQKAAADDVPALAAAVKKALPAGSAPITTEQLETALRAVIGSVDN